MTTEANVGVTLASTTYINETLPLQFTDVQTDFYASLVFTTMCTAIVIYICVSMILFACRKKFFLCRQEQRFSITNEKSRRDGAVLTMLVFVTVISFLMYMLVEMPLFWGVESPYCMHYHRTKIVCTAVGLFSVYFALWYRVYTVFYLNPLLRSTTSKPARVLNRLTLVFLFFMTIVNMTVFLVSPLYQTTPVGCLKVQSKKGASVKWGLLVSTTITFQLLLLYSLIYPLNVHRKKMHDRGLEGKTTFPLIKRAAITAGVVILSDTLNAVYALVNKQDIVYIRHIVYGTNMLINLLALLFSFTDWRERIFPWKTASDADERQITSFSSKSSRPTTRL
ncbi:uncharacterized protein LOC143470483 [Clavelina lepadiformis]|uniref:uncharacterized protein LOC143470483 n=1 Tax=Clavelina lepadiformis TaxID=159417 RepID=UPI00404296C9